MLSYHAERDESRDDSVDVSESGDDVDLMMIKNKASRRKGRGFADPSNREQPKDEDFERNQSENDAVLEDCPAQRSVEGWIVFVSNVHEEASEEHVRDAFADFGKITNLHLNIDRRSGYIKGYAMIEFEKYAEAKRAIEHMNNEDFLGLPIKVNWAFRKHPLHRKGGRRGNEDRDGRTGGLRRYTKQPPPSRY